MPKHLKADVMIWCPKCGAFVWHGAKNARWAICLVCGDEKDLSEPATVVAEVMTSGGREKRV